MKCLQSTDPFLMDSLQTVSVNLMSMVAVLQDSAAQQWSLSRSGHPKLTPYMTLALKTGSW